MKRHVILINILRFTPFVYSTEDDHITRFSVWFKFSSGRAILVRAYILYTGGGPKKVAPYEDRVFRL